MAKSVIEVNFGQREFKFDLEEYIETSKKKMEVFPLEIVDFTDQFFRDHVDETSELEYIQSKDSNNQINFIFSHVQK